MDAAHDTRRQLGQLMVDEGFITEEQLARALEEQGRTGRPLGTILVELGFVSAGAVGNALAEQHGGLLKTEFGISAGLHALPGGAPPHTAAGVTPDPLAARVRELEAQLHTVLTERNTLVQTVNEQVVRLREAAQPQDAGAARVAELEAEVKARTDEAKAHEAEVARITAAAIAKITELEAEVQARTGEARAQEAEVARITAAAMAKLAELEGEVQAAQSARSELEANMAVEAARSSQLEHELAELREQTDQRRAAELAAEPPPERAHLLLTPSPSGYGLIESPGPAPASGARLDIGGVEFVVVRVGRSPLPASGLRCAFLERV